jgi:two-component system chemotaxis response regulator CheB
MGGRILVQDPADAVISALPSSALELGPADHIGTPEQIGRWLSEMADEPQRRKTLSDMGGEMGKEMANEASPLEPVELEGWKPSVFACPDCTGVLWEHEDGKLVRFRCRIGHSFGPDALMDGKSEELESALWSAINTMEERGELAGRLANRARSHGYDDAARRYTRTAEDMRRHSGQIRQLVETWDDDSRLEGTPSPREVIAD